MYSPDDTVVQELEARILEYITAYALFTVLQLRLRLPTVAGTWSRCSHGR